MTASCEQPIYNLLYTFQKTENFLAGPDYE